MFPADLDCGLPLRAFGQLLGRELLAGVGAVQKAGT